MTLRRARLDTLMNQLSTLGPRQALNRGYAILLDGRRAVTRVEDAREDMTVLLQDGRIRVRALEIRKEDPFGEEAAHI